MNARRGMTLIEVLATVAIIAVALPPIMYGISMATAVAGVARQRAEASTLAQNKIEELAQLVALGEDVPTSGDFGDDYALYRWQSTSQDWDEQNLTQLQVTVTWTTRGRTLDVTLTTLVYNGQSRTGGSTQ